MSQIAIFFTLALFFAGNQADDSNSGPPSSTCGASSVDAFVAASANFADCASISTTTFPTAWQWALNSPYTFDYSISSMFQCAQETFTMPQFGDTSYSGSAIVTAFGKATTFNYNMSSDGTYVHAYVCGQDPVATLATWYPVAYESSNRGSYYCAKVCNGVKLVEFVCLSNNKVFAAEEKKIVDAVSQLSFLNGTITAAQTNCTYGLNSCKAFYSSQV